MGRRAMFVVGFLVGLVSVVVISVSAVAGLSQRGAMRAQSVAQPMISGSDLGVFSSSTSNVSAVPSKVTNALSDVGVGAEAVSQQLRPGAVDLSRVQLAATDLVAGHRMYVAPTDSGKLCFAITSGPVGCEDKIGRGRVGWGIFDADGRGRGSTPSTAWVIVPDDAVEIEVIGSGESVIVPVQNNVALQTLRDVRLIVSALRVVYGDGSSEEITIE